MYIKICGLRDPENMAAIATMGPTYMGFDFRSSSPRYIGQVDQSLLHPLGCAVRKVGIFDSDNTVTILSMAGRFGLNAIQVEGDKSSDALEILAADGLEVIKVVNLCNEAALYQATRYEGVVNKFIFRIPSPQQVALLEVYEGKTPFLVTADFAAVTLGGVLSVRNALMCGVDCGASFESRVGAKDLEQVRQFMERCAVQRSTQRSAPQLGKLAPCKKTKV